MSTGLPANISAIRAVFSAMFDAVDTMGNWDEEKWEDLIAVFNATGRLVLGYPHLESSESDIFGALDDIAMQLDGTKKAIVQTTTEARVVMHELHKALDPLLPQDDGPTEPLSIIPPTIPEPEETPETELSEPEPTNSPVPRADEVPERPSIEVVSIGEERATRGPYHKEPSPQEVAEFYETHTRAETMEQFGISSATVMRRVRDWEATSGQPRRNGAEPHTSLTVVPADRTWREHHR